MKWIVLALVVLASGCSSPGKTLVAPEESFVTARLASLQRAPFGCGVITIASSGTYQIISGPKSLAGSTVQVLIPCIESPRNRWSALSGDLPAFNVGDIHYLMLTKVIEEGVDVPRELPAGWLYVQAASFKPLRPNNSFKPSPLRGLVQVLASFTCPRPQSGPA